MCRPRERSVAAKRLCEDRRRAPSLGQLVLRLQHLESLVDWTPGASSPAPSALSPFCSTPAPAFSPAQHRQPRWPPPLCARRALSDWRTALKADCVEPLHSPTSLDSAWSSSG